MSLKRCCMLVAVTRNVVDLDGAVYSKLLSDWPAALPFSRHLDYSPEEEVANLQP